MHLDKAVKLTDFLSHLWWRWSNLSERFVAGRFVAGRFLAGRFVDRTFNLRTFLGWKSL